MCGPRVRLWFSDADWKASLGKRAFLKQLQTQEVSVLIPLTLQYCCRPLLRNVASSRDLFRDSWIELVCTRFRNKHNMIQVYQKNYDALPLKRFVGYQRPQVGRVISCFELGVFHQAFLQTDILNMLWTSSINHQILSVDSRSEEERSKLFDTATDVRCGGLFDLSNIHDHEKDEKEVPRKNSCSWNQKTFYLR